MSEIHNAYMRQWKRNNKEKVNAINMRVKAKKPELYREINRVSAQRVRALNPAKALGARNAYRARDPARYIYLHARRRAQKLGIVFALTREDIIIPTHCPVLGIELAFGNGQRASANHGSPSLDRVRPELGYVPGNVFVISNRANHLKNNATADELEKIVAYIRKATDVS